MYNNHIFPILQAKSRRNWGETLAGEGGGGYADAPVRYLQVQQNGFFIEIAANIFRWFVHRPSYMMLVASDEALSAGSPARFRGAWAGMVFGSLVWGGLLASLWVLTERAITDPLGMGIMPAVFTVAAMVVWPFRRAFGAAAEVLGGQDPSIRSAMGGLLAAVFMFGLLAAKHNYIYSDMVLPTWLMWLRPDVDTARLLVLMPLWGAWAILITGQFCRACERTEPAIVALSKGCGPVLAAMGVALPLAATWFYFGYMGNWAHWQMSGLALVGALASGLVACKVRGCLSRKVLLCANLMAQVSLLLGYHVFRPR